MNLVGLAKFLTGFVLAMAILFFAGASTARYLIDRLTAPPPKPVFPNDLPEQPANLDTPEPASAEAPEAEASDTPSTDASEASVAEVVPAPSPSPSPSPALPADAYRARVTQPIGLIIRQGPGTDTSQVGGVDYNQELIVLGTSADGEWLQVRMVGGGLEGWVKAGNTEQLD
jgi:hypothetical protein